MKLMRDKLVELILKAREECASTSCFQCEYQDKEMPKDCVPRLIADHLLSNGVIVPPCKVGQPVWRLYEWTFKDAEIREGKVSMLQQKADKSWKFRISVNSSIYDISTDEIGKTVFLTKEEAEQALKGEHDG